MFDSILIANRGEIACRIIRTARRLGIRTIAVHSEADEAALHVELADEAVAIGEAPAPDSYLSSSRVLAAAAGSGAQAVHPGYGFLAESAEFAEACQEAGLIFIGPPPEAIRIMGLKDRARERMSESDVPVLPGYHGDGREPADLLDAATALGFPLIIKAVAGGGGRGLRVVHESSGFDEALSAARREAQSAFGDGRVLLETFLLHPRHIEVQVFADSHGHTVHLFERDCSIQRRHQKVIEEAPAPGIGNAMRESLGDAAVRAARAIGYRGAGTVEFIVDTRGTGPALPFYFMEMNTRIQVEHPVTEMVTGLDLIEWQLRVAAGEALPALQQDVSIDGHAIEARIYAEDPLRDFTPTAGVLEKLRWPPSGSDVRVDHGFRAGDEISVHYDAMIGKLIVRGADRLQAIHRLREALDETAIGGLGTNLGLLRRIAAHPAFEAGGVHTAFIPEHQSALLPGTARVPQRVLALACLDAVLDRAARAKERRAEDADPFSPWLGIDAWQLNLPARDALHFVDAGELIRVPIVHESGGIRLGLADGEVCVRGQRGRNGDLRATLDGRSIDAVITRRNDILTIESEGERHELGIHDPQLASPEETEVGGAITAPMPGRIIEVRVQRGDEVERGQVLMLLEAMKMEHSIKATVKATVEEVLCSVDDQVDDGATLLVLTPMSASDGRSPA